MKTLSIIKEMEEHSTDEILNKKIKAGNPGFYLHF